MTVRKGLIVVAGLMTASVAHAEDIPTNAELFRMLKEQQRTISELRAELKQARQEQRAAATTQRHEVETAPRTAAKPAGREAAREAMAATTPAQAHAMVTNWPAAQPTPSRGAYVGVFGGGGVGGASSITQRGTAFFTEAAGGPLAVNATGQPGTRGVGLVGAQIGHEWTYGSRFLPALEIEGFYLASGTQRANLDNTNVRLAEQTFDTAFPMNTTVLLANAVLGFRTPYPGITPYIGAGAGVARVSIHGASSTQINPAEPGINHFNSGSDSSAWTFAAQAKAGVRLALGSSAYVFGEYRYVFVGSTDQTFGSTVDPTHVPTSPWTVRFDDMSYHLAVGGIGFNF
jgi:opacity protein-like surface antigen